MTTSVVIWTLYLHLKLLWLFAEPVLTMGSGKALQWDDMWTTVTADGSFSAQFKDTVLITESGAEVLTRPGVLEE